jgi:general transcription factor 3C polypeptide 3 (transcription factor C subunit 4)
LDRQVPNAPEPFHTLSMIYENDQPDKALQFALIAAHLSPRDSEQWVRLANSSLESENLRQALTCYSKAIQACPKNIELYETRAKLQEQCGDKKAFINAYSKLLNQLGPEDAQNILKYAKLLTKRCMHENLYDIALDGMENIFKKCPQLVTLEEVNVMTELLIVSKQFNRCLNILTKYTTIWIEYANLDKSKSIEENDNEMNKITFCSIPDDLAVDLKAKCIISLIELNEIDIVDTLVTKFQMLENPEISGDLFLDVAEAFMDKKEYKRALSLLEPLVNSENFSLAAVWLRHAESWVGCHDLNKAIKSYEIVRKLSPQHLGARMELAKLYKLKGQFNKAIQVLKQDLELDVLDPGVIYERTKLLLKVKRYNEYFQSGMLLLSRHCVTLRSKLELTALSRTSGVRQRMEILHRDRLSRGESLQDENVPTFSSNNEPTDKQEFIMMLQMCRLACKLKKYGLLQRICFTGLTSKKFSNENSHIMYLCLISCIRNNDTYDGFNVVRELVRSRKKSKTWNLLNIIIQRAEDSRHNRFMMRQLGKEDAFSYLHVLHANNCLVSGTYKYALNDYISLFKVKPSALLALLVSVTLLQMACQKFSAKKNQLVIQGEYTK